MVYSQNRSYLPRWIFALERSTSNFIFSSPLETSTPDLSLCLFSLPRWLKPTLFHWPFKESSAPLVTSGLERTSETMLLTLTHTFKLFQTTITSSVKPDCGEFHNQDFWDSPQKEHLWLLIKSSSDPNKRALLGMELGTCHCPDWLTHCTRMPNITILSPSDHD